MLSGLAVGSAATSASAQGSPQTLPEVVVTGGAQPGHELPKPAAGGQVARGGRLGLLGNTDIMDTPFNTTNFTAELLRTSSRVRSAMSWSMIRRCAC